MTRPKGEDGSVLVLTLGLTGILIALVGLVVDVSAAALARRAVSSAADGAAVSGAQGLDQQAYLTRGVDTDVPLSASDVRRRVAAYEDRARGDQPGLKLDSRVTGGATVVVTARRTVHLPFGGWLGVQDVRITAESRARAPVTER